jgi:radical SAM protein (TIGR01212 family)
VGLTIGTRPDCAGDEVLDALGELAKSRWVSIEFGLQSIHQKSLDWLRRGHDYACFQDALGRARERGLHVGVHLILGLPCETAEQMLETAEEMARLRVDAVKLHNLYVVRETPLAELWDQGHLRLPERDEYARLVVDFLERLPPNCVIDRLAGDAPPQYLLAPEWCRHKAALRQAIEAEFDRRGTRQSSCWRG